ncbi:MAG: glycosyltransferase family 39 protein [Solirubrobacteraceae bacterium]
MAQRARARLAGSDAVAIGGPALLALALSLIGITGRSLGFDEGATWAIATQRVPGHGLGAGIAHDGGNMLGFYALEHVLIKELGDSVFVMRLPSVLAGGLTTAFVAAIGLRLFDRRTAVLGAVLTAVTLSVVYWNQTARGYAPMLAFTCAGMLAFVALADPPAGAGVRASRRVWLPAVAYAAAMVLAIYCSFVAVLVIPAQLVALIWRRHAWRRFGAALVALAVCAIPLAALAAARGAGQLFWVPRPDRQVEQQVLESLTGSGLQSTFHPTFLAKPGIWITVGAVLLMLGLCVRAWRAPELGSVAEPLAGWGTVLVLCWAIVPPALVFIYSFASQPLFQPRNLVTSVPGIAFVLALGICDRRLPRSVAGAALVLALGIRLVPLALGYDVSPEPWDVATHAVLTASRPGDCVVFYPEDSHNPFQYYERTAKPARAVAPRSALPVTGWAEVRSYVERYETLSSAREAALASSCGRLWLVSSHEGQSTGPARSRHNLRTFDHFRTQLEHRFGKGQITTYGYASAIHVRLLPGKH